MDKIALGQCCEILDSMRVPITASERKPGPYPYYGANGIQDYVSDYIFDDELVLLAEDGGNFGSKTKPIAYRVSGKCWVNNHAHVLKPKLGINVDYLCYSLMFYDTGSLVNGATRQKLTQAAMKEMQIPMRSLDEQLRIVNRIKQVLSLINSRTRQLSLLDNLIKARFVEMFGDPVNNTKGWDNQVLKSVCIKITDGEHGSVERVKEGHPFLNAKHIKSTGVIDWANVTYTPDEVHERIYKRCNPESGDVMMTTTGTIGNVAVVPCDREPFTMDRGITLLKLDSTKVQPLYIAWLLRHQSIQAIMNSNIHASAIGHLFLNKVEKIPIIVPDMENQNAFSNFVHQIDKSKAAVQQSLDKTQLLFDSLMQQYFG